VPSRASGSVKVAHYRKLGSRRPEYFSYNLIRIHRTLRVTPAMAAGVTDRLFDVSDIVALLEASECKKAA
jgi:hypothetical protein